MTAIHTSREGVEMIKVHEGWRSKAYPDPATGGKPWTIGYGHTSDKFFTVKPGMTISKTKGLELLMHDIAEAEAQIASMVTVPLNANEYAALVSLVFNIGPGSVKTRPKGFYWTQVRKRLNRGDRKGAARAFMNLTKANGRRNEGLVTRRQHEMAMFLKPTKQMVDTADQDDTYLQVDEETPSVGPDKVEVATATGGTLMAILAPFLQIWDSIRYYIGENPMITVVVVSALLIGGFLMYRRIMKQKELV